jgi:hypothetical protein
MYLFGYSRRLNGNVHSRRSSSENEDSPVLEVVGLSIVVAVDDLPLKALQARSLGHEWRRIVTEEKSDL